MERITKECSVSYESSVRKAGLCYELLLQYSLAETMPGTTDKIWCNINSEMYLVSMAQLEAGTNERYGIFIGTLDNNGCYQLSKILFTDKMNPVQIADTCDMIEQGLLPL